MDAPVIRVNSKDLPLPYAQSLLEAILPSVAGTIDAVKKVLYKA
jgi:pyruvate dehydrogenase E1 component beta subunit